MINSFIVLIVAKLCVILMVLTQTETTEIIKTLKEQHQKELATIRNQYQNENKELRNRLTKIEKILLPRSEFKEPPPEYWKQMEKEYARAIPQKAQISKRRNKNGFGHESVNKTRVIIIFTKNIQQDNQIDLNAFARKRTCL